MTREEVLALAPGRELDELVIRHIMNIPIVESVDLFSQEPFPAAWWVEDEGWYIADERDEDGLIYRPFNPSEDISAAWEVVEEMGDCLHLRQHGEQGEWEAWFCGYPNSKTHGETAPEAICKASLLVCLEV